MVLGYPLTSAIKGSPFALRELRIQSQGEAVRVVYAFDPKRQAVLLLGAVKRGEDQRFYKEMIPIAEKEWENYLKEIK